ncbi:recombinase [Mesorhizobium sp. Root157]|uniref:recombination protein NinB n=1 Tax=Mesorhizobium sp. Root157 TaxID=1736477 RepID=UPI0006FC93F3|nr:recombination protein NinB [Mesorhizobium sp. Root157]KRA00273.1 recombinase [Mesorhizobium sp. Root157]
MEKQRYILISDQVRQNAMRAVHIAPVGYAVTVSPATRSLDQNAKFHAICSDLSKSQMKWAGKRRSLEEWKVLLISAHAVATNSKGEVIPGLEGEFVAIRESSARMTVGRAASLITYALAFCDTNGIELTETAKGGFLDLERRVA